MRGAALAVTAALAVPLLLAAALPSTLFGSAPTDRNWHAENAVIRIIDGETIGLGERVVRLSGLSAPTRGDACQRADGDRPDCAAAAAAALRRLVGRDDVACRIVGQDGFGRGLGQCTAHGRDLNRGLVGAGYAIATGTALRGNEASARRSAQGLWAQGAATPVAWRSRD